MTAGLAVTITTKVYNRIHSNIHSMLSVIIFKLEVKFYRHDLYPKASFGDIWVIQLLGTHPPPKSQDLAALQPEYLETYKSWNLTGKQAFSLVRALSIPGKRSEYLQIIWQKNYKYHINFGFLIKESWPTKLICAGKPVQSPLTLVVRVQGYTHRDQFGGSGFQLVQLYS